MLLSLLAAVAAPAAGRSGSPDQTDAGSITEDSLLPLAAGTTVVMIDAAVVPAAALSVADGADGEPAPGLLASYFTTADLSGPPVLERVEPSVAYRADAPTGPGPSPAAGGDELPTPTPGADVGSARWSGVLTAPVDGTYRLELATSGFARVLLDDAVVAATADPRETPQETPPPPTAPPAGPTTGPTAAAPEPLVASVDLEAGAAHALTVEYVADEPEGADRYAVLGWTPPPGALAPLVPEAVDAAASADVAVVVVRAEQPAPGVEPAHAAEPAPGVEPEASAVTGPTTPSAAVPPEQTELIAQVVAANPRTVVVVVTAADLTAADWQENVAAVVRLDGLGGLPAVPTALFGAVEPGDPVDPDDPAAPTGPPQDEGEESPEGSSGPPVSEGPAADTPPVPEPTPGTEPGEEPGVRPDAAPPTAPGEDPAAQPSDPADPPEAVPLLVRVPDAGALTLSIASGGRLVLTDQQPDDGVLRLSGELPTVTVLDDRGGPNRGGWSVSGVFTPLSLAGSPGSATQSETAPTLPADGIGWLPRLVTSGSGLVAGPEVASRPAGGAGLAAPAVLARASAEHRARATELGAAVVLDAPADAAPGSYRGTVTLTLFPVE